MISWLVWFDLFRQDVGDIVGGIEGERFAAGFAFSDGLGGRGRNGWRALPYVLLGLVDPTYGLKMVLKRLVTFKYIKS